MNSAKWSSILGIKDVKKIYMCKDIYGKTGIKRYNGLFTKKTYSC